MITPETLARRSPRETVTAFYEAFDQGALRSFCGIAAPFEARVLGATALDWHGVLPSARLSAMTPPDGKHVFDFIIAEGDSVATIGCYRGRHMKAMQGGMAMMKEMHGMHGTGGMAGMGERNGMPADMAQRHQMMTAHMATMQTMMDMMMQRMPATPAAQ